MTEQIATTPPASSPDFKWYILQTYSGFEHRVEKTIKEKLKVAKLEHLVEEVFVPSEDVERVKNGKKRKIHVIYYPGYVLVKANLTDELWHVLMDVPRVAGFVGGTNREPRPLEDNELGEIRSQMTRGIRQAAVKDEYDVGQPVIVIDGPFAATRELVAGFWLWEVKDMAEAVAWVKRCPNPMPGPSEVEIRPLYEADDLR